jgi:predicted nucleic acid-binding protein
VALKAVLPEADSDKAISFFDEFRRGIHELLAPDIFPVELAHALTRAERKRLIPEGDAILHLAKLLKPSPVLCSYLPLLPRAVEISSQMRLSTYDAIYLVLAEQEGCDFLTADRKLFSLPHVSPFPR